MPEAESKVGEEKTIMESLPIEDQMRLNSAVEFQSNSKSAGEQTSVGDSSGKMVSHETDKTITESDVEDDEPSELPNGLNDGNSKWHSMIFLKGAGNESQRLHLHSRSASEPVNLDAAIAAANAEPGSETQMSPLEGSPFDQALEAQANLTSKKSRPVRKIARRKYIKKKKKGEITREHEQYNLTYCMMLGIRYSVGKQPHNMRTGPNGQIDMTQKELSVDDFMHVDKVLFTPEGGQGTDPKSKTPAHRLGDSFKFKDYAPEVFRKLRQSFDINDVEYMLSLCGNFNFIEFISNSKSGQFFFYSNDGRYLIKTQSSSESKFLRRILPQYYMYMTSNPNSMVVRFCGMHRVKLPHLRRRMHFVIMCSAFSDEHSRKIHHIYDLKGSTVGRSAKPEETVKKDNDILQSKHRLRLGSQSGIFLDQLREDAEFLAGLKIMDYSLLVGIHDKNAPRPKFESFRWTSSASMMTAMASEKEIPREDADYAVKEQRSLSANTRPRVVTPHAPASGKSGFFYPTYSARLSPKPILKKDYVSAAGFTMNLANPTANEEGVVKEDLAAAAVAASYKRSSVSRENPPLTGVPSTVHEAEEAPASKTHNQDEGRKESSTRRLRKSLSWSEGRTSNAEAAAKLSITGPMLDGIEFKSQGSTGVLVSNLGVSPDDQAQIEISAVEDDGELEDEDDLHEEHYNTSMFSLMHSHDAGGNLGNEVYYMGIIDILQQYNSKKRAEHVLRSITHNSRLISAVNPKAYAARFVKFVEKLIE